MEHTVIGCCYFPTTVVFIDDQESFLRNITKSISIDLPYKLFTKVSDFNEFLAKHPSQLRKNAWIKTNDDASFYGEDLAQHDVSINYNLIHKQIYNLNRYDEISVAIIDFAMPECNGIELCQAIKAANPNIQTLLLTGEADHKTAVDAFNRGAIDKFLRKGNGQEFFDELEDAIHQLTRNYFPRLFDSLNMNLTGTNPLLKEKAFLELFNTIYEKHNGREYYLVDLVGGYLILNRQGEAVWLITRDEKTFKISCELANSEEDNLDEKNFDLIKQKKLIPFYHGEYINLPKANEWNEHLLPANILNLNETTCIYAEYTGFKHTPIDTKKIHSFDEYLNQT